MPDRDLYVPPNVSTEEVYRLILSLRGEIRDTNSKLGDTNNKLDTKPSKDDLQYLKSEIEGKASKEALVNAKTAFADEVVHLKERIVDLESWQTWAMRLGIPALLGIVFNLLDTFKGV